MLHTIRRLARSLLLLGMLAAASAGCVDQDVGCTTEARPGLVITVVDDATGAPVPATVLVIDGMYIESLDASAAFNGQYSAAAERPGVYGIEVSSDGYATVRLQDIEVLDDTCHVMTREIEVRLQPAAR